jgi:hypothetical protein
MALREPGRDHNPRLIAHRDLSPAKFRHVSSVEDVKAHSPRSEARRPKAAKAKVRAPQPLAVKTPAKAAAPKAKLAAKPEPKASAATSKAKPSSNGVKPKPVPMKLAAPPKAAAAKPAAPKPIVVKATPAKATAAPKHPEKMAAKATAPSKTSAAKPIAAPKAEAAPSSPPPKRPARKSIKEVAGVSTDAVARRTGKNWDDWFEVLDSAGAATLDQRGIIAILAQKHGIGPWWQQMIAVGYESLRSKSDKPPAPDGFQINSSCTLDAPLNRVFRLWNDAGERARWLADDRFVVRGATADKVIRARWGKGTSHVAVSFSEKSGKTEVSVDHHQIESRGAAEQMKAYWAKKLGLLDQALTPRR